MRVASVFGFITLSSIEISSPLAAAHTFLKIAVSFAKHPTIKLILDIFKCETCGLLRTARNVTDARTTVLWGRRSTTNDQGNTRNNDTLEPLRLAAKSRVLRARLTALSTRKAQHA